MTVTLRNYTGINNLEQFIESKTTNPYLKRFVKTTVGRNTNKAVLAWEDGEVVGIFAYAKKRSTLESNGTYVHHDMRRQGLAKRMWAYGLKKSGATKVDATAVTRVGARFLRAMQKNDTMDVIVSGDMSP